MSKVMKFQPVIGLEIHIQLNTKRKMFCYCPNDVWKKDPNTVVCPTCLGLPGALPVPNREAIKKTQMFGLALGCKLHKETNFDRKNYFYPDLPKGYQISQYDKPFCYDGLVKMDIGDVRILRIHLEEDTGKSIHDQKTDETLLDFNKSGVPLMELVTEPDIKSPEHAEAFGRKIAEIAEYIGVSDVNMERGNLRLEPSISLREVSNTPRESKDSHPSQEGIPLPNYRVEIKNINSFRFMKNALYYEIERQTKLLEKGKKIPQQTRGWDENKNKSFLQRKKEEEHEYRYFPEPDIPPFEYDNSYIEKLEEQVPKLPDEVVKEKSESYKVKSSKIEELLRLKRLELVELLVKEGLDPKKSVNEVISANEDTLNKVRENPQSFVKDLKQKEASKIDSNEDLLPIIQQVISENENAVQDYQDGNENAINSLLGQVMKHTKGKADPKKARELLIDSMD